MSHAVLSPVAPIIFIAPDPASHVDSHPPDPWGDGRCSPPLGTEGWSPVAVDAAAQNNRVGIGTTTPAFTLDVNGTANVTSLYTLSSVGIGTTAPSNRLTVSGNGDVLGWLRVGANSGGGGIVGDIVARRTATTGAYYFGDSPSNYLYFDGATYQFGLGGLHVKTDGNVGIGTTSPQVALDINKPSLGLRVQSGGIAGSSGAGVEIQYISASGQGYIQSFDRGAGNKFLYVSGAPLILNGSAEGPVGIRTWSPDPNSALHVNGTFTVTGTKNFQIAHPLDPDRKVLVHSSLEGPEVGVYYRGEAQLANGEAVVALPAYFEALTSQQNRTIQLTSLEGWSPLYVAKSIQGGQFTARTAPGGSPTQRFYWEVKAVRADVAPLAYERDKPTPPTFAKPPWIP